MKSSILGLTSQLMSGIRTCIIISMDCVSLKSAWFNKHLSVVL